MSGTIFHDGVPFGGATSVDTLVDVNLGANGPSDGDILVYDEETGMWKPSGNLGTLNSNIADLGDYEILATSTSTTSELKNISDITNYRYVCGFLADNVIRGCTSFVPTGLFKTIGGLVVLYSAPVGGSVVAYSGAILYNSDTSVNMYRTNAGQTLYLVGIK